MSPQMDAANTGGAFGRTLKLLIFSLKGRQESWVGHFFKIGTLKCQKHDILVGSIVNLSPLKMHCVTKYFFEVV